MNITHTLTLALALSASFSPMLLPAVAAETRQQVQQNAPTAEWKALLNASLFKRSQQDEALLEKRDRFLSAASAAHKAMMDYGMYSLGTLKANYNTKAYTAWRQGMEQEYAALVNELFNLDMLAFVLNFRYEDNYSLEQVIRNYPGMLPLHPGEEDFSGEPAICKALHERPIHGSIPMIDTARQCVELWHQHLTNTYKRLTKVYESSPEPEWELHREFLSRSQASRQEYKKLRQLFAQVGQKWDAYYKAATELSDMYCMEEGGGTPGVEYRELMLRRCLLDSRSRMLSAIARTFDHESSSSRSPDCFQLHSPSSTYGFGRVHKTEALLFRHPRLEGKPWCIGLEHLVYCRSFLLVDDSPALKELARKHPNGGKFELEGYHTVQLAGKPLPQAEDVEPVLNSDDEIDSYRLRYPRGGADAYRIRPVFHINRIVPEDE